MAITPFARRRDRAWDCAPASKQPTPLISAAEKEVPDDTRYSPPGRAARGRRPGRRLRCAGRGWPTVEVVVLVGRGHRDHIGVGGRKQRRRFGPALPAAATSTMLRARAAARLRWIAGSAGPAKLMLMMRAPRLAAQSRLRRMA